MTIRCQSISSPHLQTPRLNFFAEGHLLHLDLVQVQRGQGTVDLANDVVPGVPIKAQHDKVQ